MRPRAEGMSFRSAVPRKTRQGAIEHLEWIVMQGHAGVTVPDMNVAACDGLVVSPNRVLAARTSGNVHLLAQNTISLFFPAK